MVANSNRSSSPRKRRAPAVTPEGRENQLVAAAVDLAAKQMEEGTASAQVITHFLKLGSTRERLEQERLRNENELLRARTESLVASKDVALMFTEALEAMRSYSGQQPIEADDYED